MRVRSHFTLGEFSGLENSSSYPHKQTLGTTSTKIQQQNGSGEGMASMIPPHADYRCDVKPSSSDDDDDDDDDDERKAQFAKPATTTRKGSNRESKKPRT